MNTNDFHSMFANDINILAIDFDGVLHDSNKGWHDGTCYGKPIPGSIDAVKYLSSKYKLVIFTAKAKADRPLVDNKSGIQLVREWLEKYGISEYISDITAEKPRACLYIDDNGYRFQNWKDTLFFVEAL